MGAKESTPNPLQAKVSVKATPFFHTRRYKSLLEGLLSLEDYKHLRAGGTIQIDAKVAKENTHLFQIVKEK